MADNVNIEIVPILREIDIAVTQAIKGEDGVIGKDGVVQSIVGGTDITVDSTDVANPIINSTVSVPVVGVDFDAVGTDNSDNNAVNTLYSGLVSNATHTGDVTGDTALSIASGVVDETELATKYKSTSTIAALNIDWSSSFVYTKTLTGNTTFTFSNLYIGVKSLILTGNFTVAFPTGFTLTNGSEAYDGTKECLLEVICYDTSTPKGLINITYSV